MPQLWLLTSCTELYRLDSLVDLMEPVDGRFLRRPQLRDPGDELVLETVSGRVAAIAAFKRREVRPAADRFGIDILPPAEAIRRRA